MTIESFQDTLFEDPVGLRFRHAREKARWSTEAVAQQLKLPVAVIEAIEREDWARLGAPIFARSYVGSYAKILGLPATLADEVVRGKPVPQLVAIGGGSPTRRAIDRGAMNLAYLAMTILIVGSVVMLAMYFQSPRRGAEVLPPDPPSIGAIQPAAAVEPVLASMAPTFTQQPAQANNDIVLRFRGESWVEIINQAGTQLERGLVLAGTERRFPAGQLARVTLGDATAVDVQQGSAALDLAPYSEANVARFTVSSEGKISPLAGD
jgi:cytoskeleton protein RodZ